MIARAHLRLHSCACGHLQCKVAMLPNQVLYIEILSLLKPLCFQPIFDPYLANRLAQRIGKDERTSGA